MPLMLPSDLGQAASLPSVASRRRGAVVDNASRIRLKQDGVRRNLESNGFVSKRGNAIRTMSWIVLGKTLNKVTFVTESATEIGVHIGTRRERQHQYIKVDNKT
ncbi:hypothetical protein EVAR_70853_1 [Eumeta japonica]|uniref:Uncharacterized protein n=1 Tax=Eumeta variegata TaxID=151549 RepID=A0A4C1SFW8_EUMVA|nr:hypothetical protein EVAR_70853_1 [Eumeta japonica]